MRCTVRLYIVVVHFKVEFAKNYENYGVRS